MPCAPRPPLPAARCPATEAVAPPGLRGVSAGSRRLCFGAGFAVMAFVAFHLLRERRVALVPVAYAVLGQALSVEIRGKQVEAVVIGKPFYKREGK